MSFIFFFILRLGFFLRCDFYSQTHWGVFLVLQSQLCNQMHFHCLRDVNARLSSLIYSHCFFPLHFPWACNKTLGVHFRFVAKVYTEHSTEMDTSWKSNIHHAVSACVCIPLFFLNGWFISTWLSCSWCLWSSSLSPVHAWPLTKSSR